MTQHSPVPLRALQKAFNRVSSGHHHAHKIFVAAGRMRGRNNKAVTSSFDKPFLHFIGHGCRRTYEYVELFQSGTL